MHFGPISTSHPKLPGGEIPNDAPPGPLFQGHSPPFPTCAWWVGFAAPPNQDAIAAGPFPFMSRCGDDGLSFGIPMKRDFDGVSVHQPSRLDWTALFAEHNGGRNERRALTWDQQSVTIEYFSACRTSTMTTFLVPGAPYITLSFNNATPTFNSLDAQIVSVNDHHPVTGHTMHLQGSKFKIITERGTHVLYSLHCALTLVVSTTGLRATTQLNGVLRMATLSRLEHEQTLDTYSRSYPTSVITDYSFSGDVGALIFRWKVVGDPTAFIHLTWPHHRKTLHGAHYLPPRVLSYLTVKGWMIPVVGDTWTMHYTLPTHDFHPPRQADPSCLPAIQRGLEYEVAALAQETAPEPGDFYFWGGTIAAKARLALIAEHVERMDLVPSVVGYVAASIKYWMDPGYIRVQAAYETNWGAVVNKAGATNVHVDFGNGYMNDHHFHYGYILAAAATVARFRPEWLKKTNAQGVSYADILEVFARDISNPSPDDPCFTVVRHRDFFAGHSWASGIANGAGDRDQESLTEAINGYYGVLLFAIVTKNDRLRDFARLLIATEQAASIYWHMDPRASESDIDTVYPEPEIRRLVTIGNVMQWQAGAFLFWGSQKSQCASIQILPVTPINESYYTAPWVRDMLAYVQQELDDPGVGDEWKSVIYLAYSNVDPHGAMRLSKELAGWGSGNTYTNQLHFISTRPNPSGQPIMPAEEEESFEYDTTYAFYASNGRWVSSRSGQPDLVADARSLSQAAGFAISFAPGGGALRHATSKQYVTADISGQHPLCAAREKVAAWEVFKLVGLGCEAESGRKQYAIIAGSNKRYVALDYAGRLMPTATTQEAAETFTLGPPPIIDNPNGRCHILDIATGRYVCVDGPAGGRLVASSTPASDADVFVWHGDAMSFQCERTSLFVTASPDGTSPLCAAREAAMAWEHFWVDISENGEATIRALVNDRFVRIGADGVLENDAEDLSCASPFVFEKVLQ